MTMTEGATPRTPGTPCWVSLVVHGLAPAQEFYSSLFGWEFAPGPQSRGPYVRAKLDGREVAGIGELTELRHVRTMWTTFLATEDADATAERVRCSGGTVAVGPLDSEAAGRMGICADPAGAVFGLWQGREHPGAERLWQPGTNVWNELLVQDASWVANFYEAVFGFDTEKAADPVSGDGVTLLADGQRVAAIRGVGDALPHGHGPHWVAYFEAEDVDAAARRVVELGGRLVGEPQDGPWGRAAEVADPEGATFRLVRSKR
jgi:uncharacterized protein